MDDRRRWGRRVNDSGRRFGGTAGAMEGGLTAGFGAKFTAGAGAGPGGLGSGFTIVFGVAAGGGEPARVSLAWAR